MKLLPLPGKIWTIPQQSRANWSRTWLLIALLLTRCSVVFGQDTTASQPIPNLPITLTSASPLHPVRLKTLLIGESVVYAGALYGLSTAWYGKFGGFRFFDDVGEWKQFDKVGHVFTAYQIARLSSRGYLWAGQSPKRAAWYGALTGFMFQTPIEILDGFSPDYGFSVGDITANTLGAGLYAGQFALWGEERIQVKFSYHPTALAAVRPNLLGKNLSEQWLKDYNGQTYWYSANIASFLKKPARFPRWLNLSAGYGVQDFVAAYPAQSMARGYVPYRQYYLSLDVDFTRIHSNRKLIRTLLFLLNNLKVPAPTLEISKFGVKGHWVYF